VRKVRLDGVDRKVQFSADLPVGTAGPGEASDGFLLRAELARRDAVSAATGSPELGEGLIGVPAAAAALRAL